MLRSMPLTSSQWIIDFATLTRTRLRRNVNLASVLGAAGLYAKPSKGRGHVKTRITAAHLTNFLLAQATDQASDAAEVVTNLRQMKYRGFEVPYFGDGNCGEIFDRMLEGLPGGPHNSPLAEPRYLPDVIHLSTRPYEGYIDLAER
jgi:hypothetical protein